MVIDDLYGGVRLHPDLRRFEVRAKFPAATVKGLQDVALAVAGGPVSYGHGRRPARSTSPRSYSQHPDRAIPYIHYNSANDPNVTNNYCLIEPGYFHDYRRVDVIDDHGDQYDGKPVSRRTLEPAWPLAKPQPFDSPPQVAGLAGYARLAVRERCESGRIGLTANELTWERGSEGSNPSLSALFHRLARSPPERPGGGLAVVVDEGDLGLDLGGGGVDGALELLLQGEGVVVEGAPTCDGLTWLAP